MATEYIMQMFIDALVKKGLNKVTLLETWEEVNQHALNCLKSVVEEKKKTSGKQKVQKKIEEDDDKPLELEKKKTSGKQKVQKKVQKKIEEDDDKPLELEKKKCKKNTLFVEDKKKKIEENDDQPDLPKCSHQYKNKKTVCNKEVMPDTTLCKLHTPKKDVLIKLLTDEEALALELPKHSSFTNE